MTVDNPAELFPAVDENDKVIGKATRKECHATGKIHRAVHVFVFNSKGEVLFGKRSMNKDKYPGFWGNIAGHVNIGENYEDSAKRELLEEAGIICELKYEFSFKKRTPTDNENCKLFTCTYDGNFIMDKKEFDEMKFFNISDLKKDMDNCLVKMAPGATIALREFFKNRGE